MTAFYPSSSSVTDAYAFSDVKKDDILCKNINFNLNGLDVDAIPEPLSSLLQADDADIGTGAFGNGENRFGHDKDSLFICKNNNNNTFIVSPTASPPTPSSPPSSPQCSVTIDTITGFNNPQFISYDNVTERMYVSNFGNGTVSVIDTTTNTVIGSPIRVGSGPAGIAYDPINQDMYVANSNNFPGTVSVIDTTTNNLITTITLGSVPYAIAYDPINERIYVTNLSDNTVSVIDTTTNPPSVIDTNPATPEIDPITVGSGPAGIAYDPINQDMYVANNGVNTVSIIDTTTNTVSDTITVGNNPVGIAYDPDNNRMYVANQGDNTVSVIDTTTNPPSVIDTNPATPEIDPITVGSTPTGIAYDPINQDIYVTNQGSFDVPSNTVSVIDTTTNTVIDTITVGNSPTGIAYDPINHRMYVVDQGDDTVSVLNLCPRPAELQQLQSTNNIIMTTAINNNDHTMIENIIQHQDITTKDVTINKDNIIDQKEQQLIEKQQIQKNNIMSPPSLPINTIPLGDFN